MSNSSDLNIGFTERQQQALMSCWNGCLQKGSQKLRCGSMTSEKVAQVAGIIVAILATLILISALMVQCPTASTIFFILFGIAAAVSAGIGGVALFKYCKENQKKSFTQELKDLTQ